MAGAAAPRGGSTGPGRDRMGRPQSLGEGRTVGPKAKVVMSASRANSFCQNTISACRPGHHQRLQPRKPSAPAATTRRRSRASPCPWAAGLHPEQSADLVPPVHQRLRLPVCPEEAHSAPRSLGADVTRLEGKSMVLAAGLKKWPGSGSYRSTRVSQGG